MLGEVCYWIFNMSIIASVMGLIVMLVRKIRAIPRRVAVFLWLIPFIRMTVPFGLNSPYSLMSLISKLTTRTVTVYQPSEELAFSYTNSIMAAESYSPITYKVNLLEKVFAAAGAVWTIVALAILIALAIIYAATKKEIRDSRLLKENIYLSDKVDSPAVYGIFKPRIILPSSYENRDNRYVIRHEKTHIRRLDNLKSCDTRGYFSRLSLKILSLHATRWRSRDTTRKRENHMQGHFLSARGARAFWCRLSAVRRSAQG